MIGKIAAYGSGVAATAAASLMWVALYQSPKTPSQKPASGPDTGDIVVCVGAGSVLRAPGPNGCDPSQKRLVLEHAENKMLTCDDDCDAWGGPTPASSSRSSSDPLADLERRVEKLRAAPEFEVVDDQDRVIFSVAPGRLRVSDEGKTGVHVTAGADGATFTARSRTDAVFVTVGVSEAHAGVAIAEDGYERADLGRQPAGNYALRIISDSGATVAGIGESHARSGALLVADGQGRVRASATVDKGGTFNVFNTGGAALASLRQSSAGNGFLSIGDGGGAEVVKMVVNNDRYGVVLAGPVLGFPLVTGSGLPGSYILGCAGGPSCVP